MARQAWRAGVISLHAWVKIRGSGGMDGGDRRVGGQKKKNPGKKVVQEDVSKEQ